MLEFTLDAIIGTVMQHSLTDTMEDIVTNIISGAVAGLAFAYYISKASLKDLIDSLNVERLVAWARRTFPE